jgi:hypothetical protein
MDGRRAAVRTGDRSGGREGRENRPPLYGHPQKACQLDTVASGYVGWTRSGQIMRIEGACDSMYRSYESGPGIGPPDPGSMIVSIDA